MRHIDRLPIPQILQEKHDQWLKQFLDAYNNGTSKRPDSSKYGNPKILETLMSMSFRKCFYCESSLIGQQQEIDHFIEVADDPTLAYTWENLYLSCSNCNKKIPNHVISVTEVLDPCRDSDDVIQQSITFNDELIGAIPGSPKGEKTIQKYRLDSERLDYNRSRWLNKICKEANRIQKAMISQQRQKPTQEEKNALLIFMQPSQPYSLMSEIYIKKYFSNLIA